MHVTKRKLRTTFLVYNKTTDTKNTVKELRIRTDLLELVATGAAAKVAGELRSSGAIRMQVHECTTICTRVTYRFVEGAANAHKRA